MCAQCAPTFIYILTKIQYEVADVQRKPQRRSYEALPCWNVCETTANRQKIFSSRGQITPISLQSAVQTNFYGMCVLNVCLLCSTAYIFLNNNAIYNDNNIYFRTVRNIQKSNCLIDVVYLSLEVNPSDHFIIIIWTP